MGAEDGHSVAAKAPLAVIATATSLAVSPTAMFATKKRKQQPSHAPRKRRAVNSIFTELGPAYFKRACRMTCPSFRKLLQLIEPHLDESSISQSRKKRGKVKSAKNGVISSEIRLSVALRYFSGGGSDDVSLAHGMSHSEVCKSVWLVVDAANKCDELKMSYPADHDEQRKIASGFKERSEAGFDCCCGCIDGMLLWIEKPSERDCVQSDAGAKKFYCGRKHKCGLNLQATCDSECRFLDVAIGHPATTSDCLAHSASSLFHKVETEGFLAEGLCLFGDSAHVNSTTMATPFKAVRSGPKDDYNFCQSQAN